MSDYHPLDPIQLPGSYSGESGTLTFKFTFHESSSYHYLVESPGEWRFAHRGRWQCGEIVPEESGLFGPVARMIRLEPQKVDIDPGDRTVYKKLAEHALPRKEPRQYFVTYNVDSDVFYRSVKRVQINFLYRDVNQLAPQFWYLEPLINRAADEDM